MTEQELAKLLSSNPDLAVEGDIAPRGKLPGVTVDEVIDNLKANKKGLGISLDEWLGNSSKNSSSSPLTITLAYPPSANRYWRNFKGRMVRSSDATQYKKAVAELCDGLGVQPTSGKVKVDISLYRPAKRGDLDNRIKIVLDALQGFAYIDDKQVVEIHARLRDDKHNPRVEIVVTEVD